MEFDGIGEEEVNGYIFAPNVPTLLLSCGNSSAVEGVGGDKPNRFLEKQFYNKSVVVQNTRVSRKYIAM